MSSDVAAFRRTDATRRAGRPNGECITSHVANLKLSCFERESLSRRNAGRPASALLVVGITGVARLMANSTRSVVDSAPNEFQKSKRGNGSRFGITCSAVSRVSEIEECVPDEKAVLLNVQAVQLVSSFSNVPLGERTCRGDTSDAEYWSISSRYFGRTSKYAQVSAYVHCSSSTAASRSGGWLRIVTLRVKSVAREEAHAGE